MRVDIYSHNFAISQFTGRDSEVIFRYLSANLVQWGFDRVDGKYKRVKLRTFAASNRSRNVFRLHLNSLPSFKTFLQVNGYDWNSLNIVKHEIKPGTTVAHQFLDKRPPLEHQRLALIYNLEAPSVGYANSKLANIPTGFGKGRLAFETVYKLNTRAMCIIPGKYLDKWIEEFEAIMGKRRGDLMTIRGGKQLKQAIELAKAGELTAKFIIITNTTMYNYLSEFELQGKEHSYGVDPIDFFPTLKIGIRLVDEVHEHFHLNFRLDLYSHVPVTLSLSATMNPTDPFVKKMYELAFPLGTRFDKIPYKKYINVKALKYQFIEPRKIRYTQFGRTSYSQVTLEESIMKHVPTLKNYLTFIEHIVKESYLSVKKPTQKMLIFAGTVKMCTLINEHLNTVLKKENLVIRRYVGEDPFEYLINSDISVSTLKSAGTAVDIPGLLVTLMTDSIDSVQANEQALGRLRELKQFPDSKCEFIYLVCMDIARQFDYHNRKLEIFKDKAASHQLLNTGFRL